MRFRHYVTFGIIAFLLVITFEVSQHPAAAQTAEPTAWAESAPLTLVWQSP